MQTITLTNSVRRLKVGQKGNSAYISIPKNIMEALNIDKGDTVLLGQTDGVGFFKKEESLSLEAMLATVPDNYSELTKNEGFTLEDIEESW